MCALISFRFCLSDAFRVIDRPPRFSFSITPSSSNFSKAVRTGRSEIPSVFRNIVLHTGTLLELFASIPPGCGKWYNKVFFRRPPSVCFSGFFISTYLAIHSLWLLRSPILKSTSLIRCRCSWVKSVQENILSLHLLVDGSHAGPRGLVKRLGIFCHYINSCIPDLYYAFALLLPFCLPSPSLVSYFRTARLPLQMFPVGHWLYSQHLQSCQGVRQSIQSLLMVKAYLE